MLWRSIRFQGPRARRPRNSRRDAGATFFGDPTFLTALQDGLSKPSNLFYVMEAVQEMKLSPLSCGEGAEDGMAQKYSARAQLLFAARNTVVHFGNFRSNLGQYLLWRQSAWTRDGRGFSAGGQISQTHDDQLTAALRPGLSCNQRLTRRGYAFKSFHGSSIGQIQMLEDFGCTPLSGRMPAQLLEGQSGDGSGDLLLQSPESRVHERLLTFSALSDRMLRDQQNQSKLSQEGCHDAVQPCPQGAHRQRCGNSRNGFLNPSEAAKS